MSGEKNMKPTEFIKKQYMWNYIKEKLLPYITDTEYNGSITTYVLPKSMIDSELQKENNSTPIPVEYFADNFTNVYAKVLVISEYLSPNPLSLFLKSAA